MRFYAEYIQVLVLLYVLNNLMQGLLQKVS
jgi:hypothetical protein